MEKQTVYIHYKGQRIACHKGDTLRNVLLAQELSPHNGDSKWLNCRGFGSCGTCAVSIEGEVSPKTRMEKMRLNFPPHQEKSGLRLACQCNVLGDLEVEKQGGFWGSERRTKA